MSNAINWFEIPVSNLAFRIEKVRMLFLFTILIGSLTDVTGENAPSLDRARWLSGCWEGGDGKRQTNEIWMKPAGGAMLGMSRTLAGGKMMEYEFLQIQLRDDGGIVFIAQPSGQPEATFPLIKQTDHEMIFENQEHDFPQRVIYRLKEDGSLAARIEGKIDGKEKSADFPMKRSHCDE